MYFVKGIEPGEYGVIITLESGNSSEFAGKKYRFSLGRDLWNGFKLKEGDFVSNEMLIKIAHSVRLSDVILKALDVLSYSNHSKKSLAKKLECKYNIEPELAEEAAQYCFCRGYIDETYQAEKFAENAVRTKRWGRARIVNELCAKGYPVDISKEAAAKISTENYDEALRSAICKKVCEYPADLKERRKLFAFLLRLGHSPADCGRVLKELFGK